MHKFITILRFLFLQLEIPSQGNAPAQFFLKNCLLLVAKIQKQKMYTPKGNDLL